MSLSVPLKYFFVYPLKAVVEQQKCLCITVSPAVPHLACVAKPTTVHRFRKRNPGIVRVVLYNTSQGPPS